MRIACFALAALTCSVTFATIPADDERQKQTPAQEARPEQNEAQSQVQNEAQQNEAQQNEAQQNEAQPAEVQQSENDLPLHRHPTLLSMLKRNNEIRRRLGLIPHRINPILTKAAQDHANYMARTGDFQHYSNGGPQYRAGKYGFRGFVRENIAYNYRSVEDAFSVWQGSSGHYASIVSGTTEAGFGYAVSASGAVYYVGVYGNAAEGDEIGEDEGLAEKLAAEEKEKQGAADLAAAKVVVDMQVVPATAQEPVPADAAVSEPQNPPQAQQGAQTQTYNSSNRRGIFRRRR